ncbi:MAG: hypothetical protein WC809_11155 [Sinimarinibacterium sp.]|jgi:hypothetical protein
MHSRLTFLGACLVLSLSAAPARAEDPAADPAATETIPVKTDADEPKRDDEDRDDESVTYSGIGLSRVTTDFDNLKDAVNLDFTLGIRVPNLNWISAEINGSVTIIPGENRGGGGIIGGDPGNCTSENPPLPPGCTPASEGEQVTNTSDDFQMQLLGAYLVLKSPGRFYASGKVGYGYQVTTVQEIDERDRSGAVYTAGLGWRYGKDLGGVELVYSRLLGGVDAIGFNVSYGFGPRRSRYRD